MTHQNDIETEFIDISELENIPGYVGYKETWQERKERIERLREEATREFFSIHGQQSGFMKISRIWQKWKIPNLTCSMCHDDAEFFQCLPSKCLFCAYHAKSIQSYRRKKLREKRKGREDNTFSRIMSEIHQKVEREKQSSGE